MTATIAPQMMHNVMRVTTNPACFKLLDVGSGKSAVHFIRATASRAGTKTRISAVPATRSDPVNARIVVRWNDDGALGAVMALRGTPCTRGARLSQSVTG